MKKEKIRYTLQFCFDKGKKPTQATKIANEVYGLNTITENNVPFGCNTLRRPVAVSVHEIFQNMKQD